MRKSGENERCKKISEQPKEAIVAKDRDICKIRSLLYSSKTKHLKADQ